MAYFDFTGQNNLNWAESFSMTGKVPAIAKRIFKLKSDAQDFIDDLNSTAIPGLILTVIGDGNNNGAYYVSKTAEVVIESHPKLDENDEPITNEETGEPEMEEVSVFYPGVLSRLSEAAGIDTAISSAKEYTDEKFETLANALHFLGISTTDPSKGSLTIGGNVYTKDLKAGDIVIFGTKEFVYDGSKWEELGDVTGVSELLTWNEVTPAPEPEPDEDEGGEEV